MNKFTAANRPLELKAGLRAANRLYFAPMGLDLCDPAGLPSAEFVSVYTALMDGGCGFGFLGNAGVDPASRFNGKGLKLTSPAHAEALRPLLLAARARGFPLGVQLQHYGPQGVPAENGAVLSPSGIPSASVLRRFPQARTIEMAEDDIQRCIDQFVASARLACQAGASLIQIQAANGYLLSSFLSPRTNRREDDWGGTPLKRSRLLLAIVGSILRATEGKVAVAVQLGIDDGLGEGGQRPQLLTDVVGALEEGGVSALNCSIGVSETFPVFFKDSGKALETTRQGCRLLKRFTGIPMGFTGGVMDVETADAIIASGDADFIGFARAVLADNRLVAKEFEQQPHLVQRCRGDAFCFRDKREQHAERVYCCVNPAYRRPAALQNHYMENSQ